MFIRIERYVLQLFPSLVSFVSFVTSFVSLSIPPIAGRDVTDYLEVTFRDVTGKLNQQPPLDGIYETPAFVFDSILVSMTTCRNNN